MYYPEGFEYEKKDGEYESTGEGSAWRTYVRYNTSLDESVGYFKVESGVPTPLSWQLHSDFQSEEYRLAIVMLDVTGSALTARREWHSTLTHKDDAVPDGQSRVVNMLLFDIDSTASNTYEMLAGAPLNQRMPKFGESSWGMDYTGPCTYPLGFPPYGTPGRYEFQLHVYRHRNSHNLAEIAKADNLTLAMFEKVVGDDSAGYCHHARGVGRALPQGLARRRDVGRRAVHRDALRRPRQARRRPLRLRRHAQRPQRHRAVRRLRPQLRVLAGQVAA